MVKYIFIGMSEMFFVSKGFKIIIPVICCVFLKISRGAEMEKGVH